MDESGIDTYLYREYAYVLRGETVTERVLGKKFQRTNLVAAQLNGEIIAPMQYHGTTDAPLFEHWLKQWLLPCLSEDTVIVMDNASFHRKKKLFEIAEEYHKKLIFLPPYSPELNLIEHFWAKLKQWLKLHIKEFISLDDAISAFFFFYYAFIDDGKKESPTWTRMALSGIITILIMYHLLGYRTFKWYYKNYVMKYQKQDFPVLVSYNRFVEIMEYALVSLVLYIVKARFVKCFGISFIDSNSNQSM
ncbi:MAG: transposase [Oscillospiraceae bacterium]|nr:transposase [Oscillospiraceae bacterium]